MKAQQESKHKCEMQKETKHKKYLGSGKKHHPKIQNVDLISGWEKAPWVFDYQITTANITEVDICPICGPMFSARRVPGLHLYTYTHLLHARMDLVTNRLINIISSIGPFNHTGFIGLLVGRDNHGDQDWDTRLAS